ncbi:cyclin-dependent protein kinase inhibitor SMR6-like [Dendrobium catenatum]|uniref:Uncharacterized protein n=1 Tax=Dendrobium nobile TaxID=94219 RepID=A0A8T3AKJ5_DENNO|nr:cyclin-dependent protein kinase inhibitor SMR6-like [Dendrobium catenatum]KAI0497056.1 hypothetical protein KFK09_023384 [Dendrobium nobile]
MEFKLFVFVDELPELAPIGTSKGETNKKAVAMAEAAVEEDGAVTPKTDESRLKPALVCPPAPRKRRPTKRKFMAAGPPPQGFFSVPKDLASVFLSVPNKKVRVG